MAEAALDKKTILSELLKSPHGHLRDYLVVGSRAAEEDPGFYGHLVAYNHVRGQVHDAKVALPVIALHALTSLSSMWSGKLTPANFVLPCAENALAHLADLRPREYVRALNFAWDIGAPTNLLKRLTTRYLRDLEADRFAWERTALQHRDTLAWLYAQMHLPVRAVGGEAALFGQTRKGVDRGPAPRRFRILAELKDLSPVEIAGAVAQYKLPFLVVRGALGAKAKDPDVVLALIARMSPTELVTNMAWLKRLGVKQVPALRAALEEALGKAAEKPKKGQRGGATLKTARAAEALADDSALSGKLHVLQEKQIAQTVGGSVEGRWLVLGDKSGSMEQAMDTARQVAAILARSVKGAVHLVFFDTTPRYIDATGKTYEELTALTRTMTAVGSTSIGCGLRYILDRGIEVDGIAIVSDGCENTGPDFAGEYASYVRRVGIDNKPTVYFYRVGTSYPPAAIERWGRAVVVQTARDELTAFRHSWRAMYGWPAGRPDVIDVQEFDLTSGVDFYSLPNLVATMRAARYALLDEVYATSYRTLDEVLDRTQGMPVLPRALLVTA